MDEPIDEETFEGPVLFVAAANGAYYGGGMRIARLAVGVR